MNLKVMPKIFIGAVLGAAVTAGIMTCNNRSRENVDNIIEQDIFEKTETPAEIEDIADYSKEININLDKRLQELGKNEFIQQICDEAYENLGTYGASLYLQEYWNPNISTVALMNVQGEIRNQMDYATNKEHPLYEKYKAMETLIKISANTVSEYREERLEKIKEFFSGAKVTPLACEMFVTDALSELGLTDAELNELDRDLKAFKKAQGPENTQKFAEYLAYNQYKQDSIFCAHVLEELNLMDNPTIKQAFKERARTTVHRPKP